MRTVRSSRSGLAAAALVVLGLLAAAPAFACSATGGSVSARPARAESGTTVNISGAGFQGQPGAYPVSLHWGGAGGATLATVQPDEAGTFAANVTIPTVAKSPEPQFFQITAVQQRMENASIYSSNLAFEIPADPALLAAKNQATVQPPAVTSPAPVAPVTETGTQTNASAAPAQTTSAQAVAASRARTATAPAAAVAAPAPAPVAPAAVAAPEAPVAAEVPAVEAPAAPIVSDTQPLVVEDRAAMGGPRTIESGAPLWMVFPLVLVGLTLFAASSAIVIHEVRARKERAKVKA